MRAFFHHLGVSFVPFSFSTHRPHGCRQLATRGLGCDHKRINPSGRASTVDDGRAEDLRTAMRAATGRPTREQCRGVHPRLLFFSSPATWMTRPSKKSVLGRGDGDLRKASCHSITKERSNIHCRQTRLRNGILSFPVRRHFLQMRRII